MTPESPKNLHVTPLTSNDTNGTLILVGELNGNMYSSCELDGGERGFYFLFTQLMVWGGAWNFNLSASCFLFHVFRLCHNTEPFEANKALSVMVQSLDFNFPVNVSKFTCSCELLQVRLIHIHGFNWVSPRLPNCENLKFHTLLWVKV